MKKIALPVVLALTLASVVSCAPAADTTTGISIVASTNVYGSIAEAVAGPHATVTSIIDNPSQDPHSFEAGPRVQLELSKADVVIANGGGYDDFVDTLLAGSGNTEVETITAVEASGFSVAEIEENEHVWYDLNTAKTIAVTLAETLSHLDPNHAADYRANVASFTSSVSGLVDRVATISSGHSGATVMVTEPVPLYLLADAGLRDVTPPEFSTAIENELGVPPAVLNTALNLLASGGVRLLVYNEQTEGPETKQLLSAAAKNGIPAVAVTEAIPDGLSYLEWMAATIDAVEVALT